MRRVALTTVFLALVASLFLSACVPSDNPPEALSGRLDLSAWDFSLRSARLDGEWLFYWSRLVSPEEFHSASPPEPTGVIALPGVWNRHVVDGQRLDLFGVATYRLQLTLPAGEAPLAVKVDNIPSAYRLWINGRLAGGRGQVGTTRGETVVELQNDLYELPAGIASADIVLQVANFHYYMGGVPRSLRLGLQEQLQKDHNRALAQDFAITGGLFLLGLFFLGRYLVVRVVLGRAEAISLLFFLVCVFWGMHGLSSGISGIPILRLRSIGWETFCRLDYINLYLSVPALTALFSALYPGESSPRITWGVVGITALFCLSTVVAPSWIYVRGLHWNELLALAQMIYVLWIMVRALKRRREGAIPVMVGVVFLCATAVNDILFSSGVVDTTFLSPFGIGVLVLTQAFSFSLRSVLDRQKVEGLSHELEQKNLALERSDRLKDEFLANTSHELRTPLNGIIGLAESLREAAGAAVQERNLDLIVSSGRRLSNLVNDILDFSRLRNRDLVLNPTHVDLRGAAASVMAFCEPLARAKRLALHNDVPADLPPVRADEDRLQQVLYNLVGNAIKFTEKGAVRIQARLEADRVRISVRDTGVGIPEASREAVFTAFEQVDGSASRRHGGTGLGLGISRKLVELHGGELQLQSTPGIGTVFYFTLPAGSAIEAVAPSGAALLSPPRYVDLQPDAPAGAVAGAPGGGLDGEQAGRQVLVVDDDPVNLQVAVNHLTARGHCVTPVTGGQEALELIETGRRFDLVLLDVMMPGLSGFEVCRRLRHRYNGAELPILMVTARNRLADLVKGLSLGANDYITKPFAREELLARTSAQLQVRQAHLALAENVGLKNQLAQREKTLDRLRAKMTGVLDGIDRALVVANCSGEITLVNRALERWLGLRGEALLGQPLTRLFPAETTRQLLDILARLIDGNGVPPLPDAAETAPGQTGNAPGVSFPSLLSGVPVPSEPGNSVRATLRPTLLEVADEQHLLLEMGPDEGGRKVLPPTGPVSLKAAGESGSETVPDQRRLIVAVMNRALDLWVRQSATSKIELASRSGLWSVYTDRDGWQRTQTLDRYLSPASLPRRPRRQVVLQTAEYVLANCPGDGDGHHRLRRLLDRLQEGTPLSRDTPSAA